MELALFAFIGALAVGATLLAMLGNSIDETTRVMAAALGFVLWAYWAVSALNVTQTTSCCVQSFSYEGLAAIGAALAFIMLYALVRAVFSSTTNQTDPDLV